MNTAVISLRWWLTRGAGLAQAHWGLIVLLVVSLTVRLKMLWWWNTFPYGDIFNFVTIARSIAEGHYPVDEKRLPFYPLLILLGHSVLPGARWEHVAVAIAIAASLLVLVLMYAVGRKLQLGKVPLLASLFIFSSFPPFLHYSIRGYADTTSIALLVAGVLALLNIGRRGVPVILAVILGALSLTRYEGAAASLVLFFLAVFRLKGQWRKIAALTIIAVITVLPYVWLAQRSGRSLLPNAYLEQAAKDGPDGYGAFSIADWSEKYVGLWQRMGLLSAWYVPRNFYQTLRDDPLGFHQQLIETVAVPKTVVGLLATAGFIYLLCRRRFIDVLTLTLPFAMIAVPVAWWAPYTRYDSFAFPVMILSAAAGLQALSQLIARATINGEQWGKSLRYGLGTLLLLVASFGWMTQGTQEARDMLKKYQFLSLGYYQALRHAETLPGVIALANDDNISRIYFEGRVVNAAKLFKGASTAPDRWEKLQQAQVAYVLDRQNEKSPFTFLQLEPYKQSATIVANFEVTQGNGDIDTVVIYRLTQPE